MTYTFVRIKVHPKLDLTGWYLRISREALDLMDQMHRSAAISMFLKFGKNPHLYDQKTWAEKSDVAQHYNPVKLSAGWLQSALKGIMQHGVIYMNSAHGMLFGENVEIVETRESDALEFPASDNKDGVKITISKWALAEHYYLSAANNQVFSQPKFNTYEEAITEARKYAHDQNITFFDGDKVFQREGD